MSDDRTNLSAPGARQRPANVSLKQLRAFAAVAREGSFTRAAQSLFLSQSALSALISGLESELGLRLLDRTTRRVLLTEAGQELVPTVERVLGDLDQAAHELRLAAQARRGRVRLGTTPLLAASMLPELMHSFAAAHPGIQLLLSDASADVLVAQLRQGELDLALATFDQAAEPDLELQTLLADPMVLVCHADHALAARRELGWAALLDEPLLLLKPGSGLRALVERSFAGLQARPRLAQEVSHISTALALAAAGLGVAVLPAYALKAGGAAAQGLVGVPLVEPRVQRELALAQLRQRSLSPAAQALATHLRACLAAPTDGRQRAQAGTGLAAHGAVKNKKQTAAAQSASAARRASKVRKAE